MARIYFHVQSWDFYSLVTTSSGNGSVYSSEPRATLEGEGEKWSEEEKVPPRDGGGGWSKHGHDLVAANKRKKGASIADEKNSQKGELSTEKELCQKHE